MSDCDAVAGSPTVDCLTAAESNDSQCSQCVCAPNSEQQNGFSCLASSAKKHPRNIRALLAGRRALAARRTDAEKYYDLSDPPTRPLFASRATANEGFRVARLRVGATWRAGVAQAQCLRSNVGTLLAHLGKHHISQMFTQCKHLLSRGVGTDV